MSTERRYSLLRHQHSVADMLTWDVFGNGTIGYWDKLGYVRSDGVMEVGRYIDFHESNIDADDYDYRLWAYNGILVGSGAVSFGSGTLTGPTNVLPAAGYHNESTALSLRYSADANYGLAMGVVGSGVSWIQSMRSDGTATTYDLQLQPRGGGVIMSITAGTYLVGGVIQSNWNEGAISSDNALTFARASNSGTNSPLNYDNANGQITYNYHSGGYCRQFGFVDTDYGLYTRYQTNNTWGGWHRIAMYSGATGYLDVNTYDTWSSSGWNRTLRLNGAASSNALQICDAVKNWGIGNSGGLFYFMHTTSDTSAAPGMTYPLYHDGTYWVTNNSVIVGGHVSIPDGGYAYFMRGQGSGEYIGYNTTSSFAPVRIAGSKGGYGGFYDVYSGVAAMFDASGNGGFYREASGAWYSYYLVSNASMGFGGTTTSASYKIYVTGSAYATGTWTASDERKKENIRTLKGALDMVSMMRGVEYNWKADADVGQDPNVAHVGVIAQEVQAVVPSAVHYAEDADSYAVDYNGLVGLLIQAVKELREELNEYKANSRR